MLLWGGFFAAFCRLPETAVVPKRVAAVIRVAVKVETAGAAFLVACHVVHIRVGQLGGAGFIGFSRQEQHALAVVSGKVGRAVGGKEDGETHGDSCFGGIFGGAGCFFR